MLEGRGPVMSVGMGPREAGKLRSHVLTMRDAAFDEFMRLGSDPKASVAFGQFVAYSEIWDCLCNGKLKHERIANVTTF